MDGQINAYTCSYTHTHKQREQIDAVDHFDTLTTITSLSINVDGDQNLQNNK